MSCVRSARRMNLFLCSQSIRSFSILHSLAAGHNKWSKVRHIKIPKDIQKNRDFQIVINQINTIVSETRNPILETNHRLKRVFEDALDAGFVKAKLLNAIQNASKVKVNQDNLKISVPNTNIYFAVKTYTTMHEDTVLVNRKIKKLCEKESLKRSNISLSDVSPDEIFEPKVMACVKSTTDNPISEDYAFELGLNAEAEDIEFDDESKEWVFVKSGVHLQKMKTILEKHATVDSCELIFVPYIPVELSKDGYAKAENLFSQLNEIENVTNVFKSYQDSCS
ncbi:putative transcriptional regulatory protein TGRD_462 [Convolutriloba macropyga]|uniref:putative transcriptional regulatory protein TGRD_462 n=1 Tax=Convolutriloba macropyga TaxID=536237 RepID=UPI003F523B95